MGNLSDLQTIFAFVVIGLAGFWILAVGYELYLRLTIKCVNCIVEDPSRVRFFKRLSLTISILCLAGTVGLWVVDSYFVFVVFIMALYFFRMFILARSRYHRLMEEDENGDYNPNKSFGKDLKETANQFKILITSPRKFFDQN